ncbi:MAG: tRNA lysidine(34) synthetase TilS [Chloroflexi bacterium]|nr:tRNA lysidine(34) synthetase TilS [Chloroflexota bacterium]
MPFAVLERARQLLETGIVGQQMDLPGQVQMVLGYGTARFAGGGEGGEQLWLRPRRPGERIQPLGLQGHSQTLKKVMNERQIPALARGRWPILATTQHPLWLVGHTLDHRAQVLESSQQVIRVRAFMRH